MSYQVKNFMYLPNLYVKTGDNLNVVETVMSDYNTDKVFIVDGNKKICGFISRDLICELKRLKRAKIEQFKVEELAQKDVHFISVYPQNNVAEALKIMQALNIKYLPVCKSLEDRKIALPPN